MSVNTNQVSILQKIKLALAVAPVMFTLWPALAFSGDIVAGIITQVESRSGSVKIEHQGQIQPALAQSNLYKGDRIIISGNAYVCLETSEYQGKCYDKDSSPIVINSKDTGDHNRGGVDLMAVFFPKKPSQALAVAGYSRGNGQDGPVTPSALAPFGVQFMPEPYTHLSMLWAGGQAESQWRDASSAHTATLPASGVTYAEFDFDAPVTHEAIVSLKAPGAQTVTAWTIRLYPSIPAPPWFDANTPTTTTAARIERAAWILRDGPIAWRLFALTELSHLEQGGSFEAKALLSMARSANCSGQPEPVATCPFVPE